MKNYTKKTDEERKKEIENLTSKIEEGVEKYTETPEQLKAYLAFMSKFYNYSLSNSMLIDNQFNGAIAVGSFKFWKDKGYSVNKGEKGIKVLVPNKLSPKFMDSKGEWKSINAATSEERRKIEKRELKSTGERIHFSIGNVFDISQTTATTEDLPQIFPNRWIEGNIENYDTLYKGMENIAKKIGVGIVNPKSELGVAKGVSYTMLKEVALNPRNSQIQNVKTLLHELTHAKLHTKDTSANYTAAEKEFQAEMTAFTVCSYFNIDTSEYSLNYIHHWSKGDIRDKRELLNGVHKTAKEYIEVLEETLIKEREITKEIELEKKIIIQEKELGSFFDREKLKESIYINYKDAPEGGERIDTIEDLKDYIIDYMEPSFENSADENDESFEEEVENTWGKIKIIEWCMINDIQLSKYIPKDNESETKGVIPTGEYDFNTNQMFSMSNVGISKSPIKSIFDKGKDIKIEFE